MHTSTKFKFTVNNVKFESEYEKLTGLDVLDMTAERGAIDGKPDNYILQSLDSDDRQYKLEDPVDLSVDHQFIAFHSGPAPVT